MSKKKSYTNRLRLTSSDLSDNEEDDYLKRRKLAAELNKNKTALIKRYSQASSYTSNNLGSISTRKISSNIFSSVYQELREVNLSLILNEIQRRANFNITPEGYANYEILLPDGKSIKFTRPITNANTMFSTVHFLRNYINSFGEAFPSATKTSIIIPGLSIKIKNDLILSDRASIWVGEINDFRFLVCFFFGIYFHVRLENCQCYMNSIEDWIAYSNNITKNCIDSECMAQINANASLFDPLIHGDCTKNQNINFVFTMINLFGSNNKITIKTYQNTHVIEKND